MSFLKNLFRPPAAKASASPKPAAAQYPPVPANLPKIAAPNAGQIAQSANPSPGAQQILAANPQQSPSQYLSALQEKRMGEDMVKTMAHGMPDREGVHWAAQSAEKISDKLPPNEVQGLKAAQTWAENPTPENQAAAAAAAAEGGCRGPGSLAAQGAAWSHPPAPAAAGGAGGGAGAPSYATAPRLTPHAVSGAVLMASAIQANPAAAVPAMAGRALAAPATTPVAASAAPQTAATVPAAVQAETFKQQHPFIKMGLDIASGKTPLG